MKRKTGIIREIIREIIRGNHSLLTKEWFPRSPSKKADWVKTSIKKTACFSTNKTACFPVTFSFIGGETGCFFIIPLAGEQANFLYFHFTPSAFLGGGAKRPACQWQERPLGRRAPRASPETSGGSGSEPTRRLRLRKGGPSLPPKNQTVKKVSNKLAGCNEGRPALHF